MNLRVFIIVGIIFLIIGLGLIVGGIAVKTDSDNFIKNAEQTQAEITRISKYSDSDGDTDYEVYIKFTTTKGITYTDMYLNFYSSSMYTGQKITVYYLPDNPFIFRYQEGDNILFGILLGIGVVFGAVGLGFFILIFNHSSRKKLKLTGMRHLAVIESAEYNKFLVINGRKPMKLICTDKTNRIKYKSHNIMLDISDFVIGDEIDVFVHEHNPKIYLIDVDSYLDKKNVLLRNEASEQKIPVKIFCEYCGLETDARKVCPNCGSKLKSDKHL